MLSNALGRSAGDSLRGCSTVSPSWAKRGGCCVPRPPWGPERRPLCLFRSTVGQAPVGAELTAAQCRAASGFRAPPPLELSFAPLLNRSRRTEQGRGGDVRAYYRVLRRGWGTARLRAPHKQEKVRADALTGHALLVGACRLSPVRGGGASAETANAFHQCNAVQPFPSRTAQRPQYSAQVAFGIHQCRRPRGADHVQVLHDYRRGPRWGAH